jgi:hypothetical protein
MTSAIVHDEQALDPAAQEILPIGLTDVATTEKRKLRIETLGRFAGLWATRQDIPADGLEYERELRKEWQ